MFISMIVGVGLRGCVIWKYRDFCGGLLLYNEGEGCEGKVEI